MMVPTFKNRLVVFFSNYYAEKKRCYIPVSRKKPKDYLPLWKYMNELPLSRGFSKISFIS